MKHTIITAAFLLTGFLANAHEHTNVFASTTAVLVTPVSFFKTTGMHLAASVIFPIIYINKSKPKK